MGNATYRIIKQPSFYNQNLRQTLEDEGLRSQNNVWTVNTYNILIFQ